MDFRIPIFPVDSTAACVSTTVWVGVAVVVFFNLRFGWTLSGLVVPGYLVPLLFVKPVAVVVILAEAVITYWISRFVSDFFHRRNWWSSFFGRDRFMAIVLVSVLVRAGADGWLLPAFGRWLNETFDLQIDYRNNFHSYGLIVVALIANYFWKPGLLRGLFASLVSMGLTYAILQFVLMRYTNFSLGGLRYMYEDVSTSLLSSPKAYVIVITSAFVASWLNLRYSWDFNGILVPSLLGLLWHDPSKIAVSFVEAGWLLLVGNFVLTLPLWRRVTVEGGRKLLLFFSIAATHRLLLAHLLPAFTEIRVTDAYGFGYLLTTLIAVKAHDKKIPLRVGRATIQASMMGSVAGSIVGYALSFVAVGSWLAFGSISAPTDETQTRYTAETLDEVIDSLRVELFAMKVPESYRTVLPGELRSFREGVKRLLTYCETGSDAAFSSARGLLSVANYEVTESSDGYLILQEAEPVGGWGLYVLRKQSDSTLFVEVPAPLEEWATLEAGFTLFEGGDARAIALSTTTRNNRSDRTSDVLAYDHTIFAEFHRVIDLNDTVQVRGWTETLAKQLKREGLVSDLVSEIWIRRSIPPSLNRANVPRLETIKKSPWQDVPETNVLRDSTPRGFAQLILSEKDRRIWRNRIFLNAKTEPEQVKRNDGALIRTLLDDRETIARRGSNAYVQPLMEEMLYFDDEVVRPLVTLAKRVTAIDQIKDINQERLQTIAAAASALDYQVVSFHDEGSEQDYFVLSEVAPKTRHWGTFVFRLGVPSPYLVEIPRPLYERNTHKFGINLFDRTGASALLIAGSHPLANADGTADVTRMANRINAFQLVRQILLREFSERPMVIIQSRAIQAPVNADVIVATDNGAFLRDQLPPLVEDVVTWIEADGMRTQFVDGSEQTAGYELGIHFQAWGLNHSANKKMVSLWLSPTVRRRFQDSERLRLSSAQFAAIGVETVEGDLFEVLQRFGKKPWPDVDPTILESMVQYRANNDILHLYNLVQELPRNHHMIRVVDGNSDQAYLLIVRDRATTPIVFNVDGALSDESWAVDEINRQSVRDFILSRRYWLEFGGRTP